MTSNPFARTDKPRYEVNLWPNRSLGRVGFRNTMLLVIGGITIAMLPLFLATHSVAILLFGIIPVVALYLFIQRNYRDARLSEQLRLWDDLVTVERREPDGAIKRWYANPYWVTIKLRDQPVENYLTLKGNNREIELGAFLSPEERAALKIELDAELRKLDINA